MGLFHSSTGKYKCLEAPRAKAVRARQRLRQISQNRMHFGKGTAHREHRQQPSIPPNVASTATLPAPGQANRSKDGPIFNTRLRSGSVEVRLIRSRPRFAIKLWEFIEQIIRGEHDAAWYGRESPRATAHARISRRRISRHPIRGPSWQAQSA